MKVNVTCMDCDITVEEVDGKCVVTASKGGEVVEEFSVDCGEGSEENDVDVDDVDVDVETETEVEEVEDVEDQVSESVKTFSQFFVNESEEAGEEVVEAKAKDDDCNCDEDEDCDCED